MRISTPAIFLLLLLSPTLFLQCGSERGPAAIDTVATPIADIVARMEFSEPYFRQKVRQKTEIFYRANEYRWYWLGWTSPGRKFTALMEQIRSADTYGLTSTDYHIDILQHAVDTLYDQKRPSAQDISQLEVRISATYFLFTTHLLEGRIRYPGAKDFLWKRDTPLENDIALLLEADSPQELEQSLDNLHPDHPYYGRLKETLALYNRRIADDTLDPVSVQIELKIGTQHQEVVTLRRRLALNGVRTDIHAKDSDVFDEELAEQLAAFQRHHGLEPTGQADKSTLEELNTPIEERARQIALNLERLRWRPHLQSKNDEILVNVPEYKLRVFRDGKEKMQMRVVLGSAYTPTPIFHDTLKYIVFSPTWAVPQSIFEKEFLPKLREDPEHFAPERFEFYRNGKRIDPREEKWKKKKLDPSVYRVVETPGDQNALGKVKFIMPNDFSIYLHDTPAQALFSRDERALSHGCIRLEKPIDLALYILEETSGDHWNRKAITEAMNSGKPVHVDLNKPWPVYITYHTVRVDEEGNIFFFKDIYGHDRRQMQRLTAYATSLQ